MAQLLECAMAYQNLLNTAYRIILGRKGKLTELQLCFEPVGFHHLIGLHKLGDLRISRASRKKVFHDILNGKITYEFIAQIYTMLYKEKICLLTGAVQIQYDRLTPKISKKAKS